MRCLITCILVVMSANAYAETILTKTQVSRSNGWWGWCHETVTAAGGSLTILDGAAVAKSPAIETQSRWKIQLVKQINIDAAKRYDLKFNVDTTKAGRLEIVYSSTASKMYFSTNFDVQAGLKEYECILEPKKGKDGEYGEPRNLYFWLGDFKDATIILSDVFMETVK